MPAGRMVLRSGMSWVTWRRVEPEGRGGEVPPTSPPRPDYLSGRLSPLTIRGKDRTLGLSRPARAQPRLEGSAHDPVPASRALADGVVLVARPRPLRRGLAARGLRAIFAQRILAGLNPLQPRGRACCAGASTPPLRTRARLGRSSAARQAPDRPCRARGNLRGGRRRGSPRDLEPRPLGGLEEGSTRGDAMPRSRPPRLARHGRRRRMATLT